MSSTDHIDDSVLDQIRKLLRLGEHETANPHEAAVALEKAQALLLRHNLDRMDIDLGDESSGDRMGEIVIDESSSPRWKLQLLHTIALHNFCTTVRVGKTGHLFGTKDNVLVVREMYGWVKEQLENMATVGLILAQHEGSRAHGKSWKVSFYNGATVTIERRLSKPVENASSDVRALVLVNDTKLVKAVKTVFPNTHKGPASRSTSSDAFGQGRRAGEDVTFARTKGLGNRKALE